MSQTKEKKYGLYILTFLESGGHIFVSHMNEETQFWIEEVRKVMAKGGGPFRRLMIAQQLMKWHDISHQEAMLNVSVAIQFDKKNKPRLFKIARPGWWELA